MALPVHIEDGGSTSKKVLVSSIGELIVREAYAYDETCFQEMTAVDTAYSCWGPKTGEQFVISFIRMKASRSVSNTVDATIIIYEASSETSTTVDKVLHEELLIRGESATLPNLHLLVNIGKWINIKTDDATVTATLMGHYIPKVS